jgi:cell division protein FtsA
MEEIIAQVYFEIEASGMLQNLGAGIVLTGGGAMLRNLSQLVAFKTGMDVRIGLPNQIVYSATNPEINQPTYATAIGLMLMGFEGNSNCCTEQKAVEQPRAFIQPEPVKKVEPKIEPKIEEVIDKEEVEESPRERKPSKRKITSIFDKLGDFFEVDDEKM